jgi:hypothetical protein
MFVVKKIKTNLLENKRLVFSCLCVGLFVFWITYEYAGLYYIYIQKKKIEPESINGIIHDYSGECVSYFLAAFNEKYEMGLMRFGESVVYVSAMGDFDEEDVSYLKTATGMLNKALGEEKFKVIDYSIIKTDIPVVYLPYSRIKNGPYGKCSRQYNSFTNEIKFASVYIYKIEQINFRKRVVMHELLHAIGFGGHPISLFDNTFLTDKNLNPDIYTDSLLFFEAEAIKMLYDKRLPNHLTREMYIEQVTMSPLKKSINIMNF